MLAVYAQGFSKCFTEAQKYTQVRYDALVKTTSKRLMFQRIKEKLI